MLLALVVILGATEVHGQATGGVQATEAVRIAPFVQAQLGVAREFGETTLAAQASVAMRFDATTSSLAAQDLGSFLESRHRLRRGWVLSVKVLPLNTDVLLPTSDWANRWGRGTLPFNPALVVTLEAPGLRAWLALRPSVDISRPLRWNQGVLAGVASTSQRGLRFDARAAALDYGKAGNDPLSPVPSRFALLANALVGYVWNEDVGPALDFANYLSDPTRFERFFVREPSRHARAARVTLEGGLGGQWLPANDRVLGVQSAGFVDLQARVRLGWLRLFATGRFRTLTHVDFDTNSTRVSDDGQTQPELTALFGADLKLGESGLRPGLMVRVMRPASPRLPENALELSDVLAPSLGMPHLSAKASLMWQFANVGSLAAEVEAGTNGVRWFVLGQVRF